MSERAKSEINKAIGAKLKEVRRAFGEKQEVFAARLGFTQKEYTKLETGNRSFRVDDLYQWARLLKWHPLDLLPEAFIRFDLPKKKNKTT